MSRFIHTPLSSTVVRPPDLDSVSLLSACTCAAKFTIFPGSLRDCFRGDALPPLDPFLGLLLGAAPLRFLLPLGEVRALSCWRWICWGFVVTESVSRARIRSARLASLTQSSIRCARRRSTSLKRGGSPRAPCNHSRKTIVQDFKWSLKNCCTSLSDAPRLRRSMKDPTVAENATFPHGEIS